MRNRGHAAGFVLSCWLAVAALPLADVANASSMDEAQAAYAEGRFTDAARIAESLGTSRGFALAVARRNLWSRESESWSRSADLAV